jgi:hypothetical protein
MSGELEEALTIALNHANAPRLAKPIKKLAHG